MLKVLVERDELGREAFLKKYGFGEARSYVVVHEGREYDSKAAVAGVAQRSTVSARWEGAAMQDALFDLPETPPEHAVIARFQLGGDGLGESDQWSQVFEAEQSMGAAVAAAGVGEVDGNEFGGGEVVIFAYGPDADALYRVMEPGLCALPFRPAHVVLRYGEPDDDVVSVRVDL